MKLALHVAEFPARVGDLENPYRSLFDDALSTRFELTYSTFEPNAAWAHEHGRQLTLVHIHWPEGLWRDPYADHAAEARAVTALDDALTICHALGARVVWTVHNHVHHDGVSDADRAGYATLARHAQMVVCHSDWSARYVRSTYGSRVPVVVMPIGSFGAVHPAGRPREQVVRELGLDAARPVAVCAGQLRGYKGLDTAIDGCLAGAGVWQLAIVGRPGPFFDPDDLRRRVAARPDVVAITEHVSNDRFGELLAAADVVLLPYEGITGSSVPPAAWAVGTPVVASRLPYFEELLAGRPYLGRLFEPGDPAGLAAAVAEVLSWPSSPVAAATSVAASDVAWNTITKPIVRRYTWWAVTRPVHRQLLRAGRVARRLAHRTKA